MALIYRLACAVLLFFLCNAILLNASPLYWVILVLWFLYVNGKPRLKSSAHDTPRLRRMMGGYELFQISALVSVAQLVFLPVYLTHTTGVGVPVIVGTILLTLAVLFVLMANGYFRILLTSTRLRLVMRLLLLFLWWCPIVNLVLIGRACRLVKAEYRFDTARQELDDMRKENEICRTKYPILLVHGIFFRDWQLVNYWGRIPKALVRNGADLHYGGQQSAAAVASSAAELKETIQTVLAETGAEKVNIIAHSKGGLDARYAISKLGMAPYVASLTTINTPHRGCIFAQVLMDKLPGGAIRWLERKYNAVFHTLGDREPDFLAGVTDLRADVCARFNQEVPDMEGVCYQSVMSTMKKASSAPPPLNLTYLLVKQYDKEANDGLVSLSSAQWTGFLGNVTAPHKRGVSHGDIIDLMREDIDGFDVREFYVGLVRDLKERGF